MTNSIALITVILTNCVSLHGDFKREDGTNYVRQRLVVTTRVYVEEVTLCTNRTLLKEVVLDRTNAPVKWSLVSDNAPPLPGVFKKP